MTDMLSLPPDDEPQALALQRVISSGLPLATGLRAYAEECPWSARSSLLEMARSVENGQTIDKAVQSPDVRFPAYLRELIQGGARTGSLGPMLEEYLRQRRLQKRFGQKVAFDLAYPLVVTYFCSLICFVMLLFLVPMFGRIFDDFGIELPAITSALIELSTLATFLETPITGLFIIAGVAMVIFLLGGRWSKALVDRIPYFGGAARLASMSEFCSLLAPLVETSVPLPQALQAVASTMQPSRLKSNSAALAAKYDGTQELSNAARHLRFPHEIVHLLRWENRGGAFGEILRTWAELFARMASVR